MRLLLSCASALSSILLFSGEAWAQCAPSPSQAGQAVTCTGAVSGGYVITTDASPLTVSAGSSLVNSGGDALRVSIPANGPYMGRSASISIAGNVAASGGNGITLFSGPPYGTYYDYYGTSAAITIAAGGSVSGDSGIAIARSPGAQSVFAPVNVSIDNFGTITGTQGTAITNGGSSLSYGSITNEAGGIIIGAINANFVSLTNQGTIDGGALDAITAPAPAYSATITNSGTIRSVSSDATIKVTGVTITNGGMIANTGTGAAIANAAIITNRAGGTISASAGTAISGLYLSVTNAGTITAGGSNSAVAATGSLNLVNSGTINGNVVAAGSTDYVDSSQGTINGNVVFGSGTNTLVAALVNGALRTGITGTISAGSGSNSLQVNSAADSMLASSVNLPANFTQLAFAPSSGTALTLADGFSTSAAMTLVGGGTLTNATTLSGSGTVLSGGFFAGTINNAGTITSSNGSGPAAVVLSGYAQLTNSGRITASGAALFSTGGGIANSGTITAGGTAVDAFVGNGTFANSGSIISTGGTAVSLSMSCTCSTSSNSGTINGVQVGLDLRGAIFVNSGAITSAGYGVALGGTLQNQAGAVITGGTVAIGVPNGAPSQSSVSNAGTINGDVRLANAGFGTNTYVALTGGVLNGNLTLGVGDTLITDLTNTGSGAFSGITGTVSTNRSNLIYNVNADASATAALPAGFTSMGYQLGSNATLTLGTSGTLGTTLGMAGAGSLIFNGSLATTDAAALQSQSLRTASGYSSTANTLVITNNGTIGATRTSPYGYFGGAVALGGSDTLANNGVISFVDTSGSTNPVAAVWGGGAITNSGTITATNASAVLLGAAYSYSGVPATLTNSGLIRSIGAAAIASAYGSYGASVVNSTGGTISSDGDAINLSNGTVSNAGTINGNVNLAGSGIYIANGGALNGDLNFGSGYNNMLIETGAGYGVSGSINLNGGRGYIGHLRNADATVALGGTLPAGFNGEFVVASGANTLVTITGPAVSSANLFVGGDGAIINQANSTGVVNDLSSLSSYSTNLPFGGLRLASFTNQASIGGINLAVNTLVNTGTINTSVPFSAYWYAPSAVSQGFSGALDFRNTGQISIASASPFIIPYAVQLSGSLTGDGSASNSGTINGAFSAGVVNNIADASSAVTLTLNNSGTITGSHYPAYYRQQGALAIDLYGYSYYSSAPVDFSLINSGTIVGDIFLDGAANSLTETASGKITGNLNLGGYGSTNNVNLGGAFTGDVYGPVHSIGTLALTVSGGSATAPIAFGNLDGITSYSQSGGYATVSGLANMTDATITGGTLIGLVGSTINATQMTVSAGGTFGSGGTVNANVTVNGMLRVGASPDTLTLNGNLSLGANSTTLFEISPSASSKLVTSGSITIAPGATVRIEALQLVRPNTSLQLISAAGGITGSFTSLSGIAGKLSSAADSLSVLVLFDPSFAPNAQTARAVTYVNGLLSGPHSAALDAALPSLIASNNAPLGSAFARLSAEPYASAGQIAVESGLTVAKALRDVTPYAGSREGPLFSFGQVLGDWRSMAGDAQAGTSQAKLSGFGFLGGLGVAGQIGSLALFGGYLDQNQRISALGASTRATGFVGGVVGRLAAGPAQLTISLARDLASARTRRVLADASRSSATYDLHSWMLDASAATHVALTGDWQVSAHMGTSWIWTNRAAISESVASPFALSVASDDHAAGFIDAGLRFETVAQTVSRFSRFLDVVARWQVQGKFSRAWSGFAGQLLSLLATGDRRSPVSAVMSLGGAYALTPGVSLFVSGGGEMSGAGSSANVRGGLRMRF